MQRVFELKNDPEMLVRLRSQCRRSLTGFAKAVQKFSASPQPLSPANAQLLQERVKASEGLLAEYQTILLFTATPTDDTNQDEDTYETAFYDTLAKARALLAAATPPAQSETSSARSQNPSAALNSQLHLPKIKIPIFTGLIEQWLTFKDVFQSMVHNRDDLSDLQKFHYMRGSLEGDAATIISNIATTEANYEAAWAALCNRFDDKKRLVAQHLDELLNLPAIETESAQALRQLVDGVNRNIHALRTLNENPDGWQTMLLHIIARKLDYKTRRDWEARRVEVPTVDALLDHLLHTATLLEKVETSMTTKSMGKSETLNPQSTKRAGTTQRQVYLATRSTCLMCQSNHLLFQCPKFQASSSDERMSVVNKHRLCINCLRDGHRANRCQSKGRCFECQQRHHTKLHERFKSSSSPAQADQQGERHCLPVIAGAPAILPTARVVVTHGKRRVELRALLDSASQCSLITERACRALRATPKALDICIRGVTGSTTRSTVATKVTVTSLVESFSVGVTAFVVPTITTDVPGEPIARSDLNVPEGLDLADTAFDSPAPIDLLLGTEHFWALLRPHSIQLKPSGARLQRTAFGWVVCGPNHVTQPLRASVQQMQIFAVTTQLLDKQLQRFWVQEEPPQAQQSELTPEQEQCENLFKSTTTRTPDGRFLVRLPHSSDVATAPASDTLQAARKRLQYLERRLCKEPEQRARYAEFLHEYAQLGHMRLIPGPERADAIAFYLPHHAVLKAESTTTKLRVVFDGSAKMTNAKSVNDYHLNGLIPQRSLVFVLLSFRMHRYAVTADVAKMYRQVWVHPDDRFLQRIVWRTSPDAPMQHYELQTLTYGTKSAAFLATRCLHEIGALCADAELKRIIQEDFYVDDLLTGHDDPEHLKYVCERLVEHLSKFGFPLRKWRSNCAIIPQQPYDEPHVLNPAQPSTALGVVWHHTDDVLTFKCGFQGIDASRLTKRTALSVIAQVFDPLGLVAPVTVLAKAYMQQLWTLDCSWDDILPEDRREQFVNLHDELLHLEHIRVPRYVSQADAKHQLHVFCDASQKAYGAAAYLRSSSPAGMQCHLLCARTRVAPLKTLTIPRLELCAAAMGARLAGAIKSIARVDNDDIILWSDSTIALAWIATPTYNLQTYEANRVGQITDLFPARHWRHVNSEHNPADICSRGASVSTLVESSMWWHGPDWLREAPERWPSWQHVSPPSLPGLRCMLLQQAPASVIDFHRFSSYNKLLNTVMYVRRFSVNARVRLLQQSKLSGAFSADERADARRTLVRLAQAECYGDELAALNNGRPLPTTSTLHRLTPYVDANGLIRIRGRLQNEDMDEEELHPALVAAGHPLAKLWFNHLHRSHLHCGPTLLIAASRRHIWVPRARDLARKVVHACITCWREKPKRVQPMMGNLPTVRTTPSPPFSNVGIDCAGPFDVASSHLRGARTYKSYIVVFVCLVTKALHLELVSDMSTTVFLAAFRRFCARRGTPFDIYSDNGRNFVGAAKELRQLIEGLKDDISAPAEFHACRWHFIPPYAPHFGGLWEAAVRQTKYHLKRTLKGQTLSYEEMNTLLCQVEGILNSRPLSELSDDPTDLNPLTPAHFLTGRNSLAVPDRQQDVQPNQRLRFRRVQHLQAQFWQRWSREYLRALHVRSRWVKGDPQGDLRINELVIVEEPGLPSRQWMLGRVVGVAHGADGIVRVATLRTSRGTITRPVRRLCRMPIEPSDPAAHDSMPAAGGSMSRINGPASDAAGAGHSEIASVLGARQLRSRRAIQGSRRTRLNDR